MAVTLRDIAEHTGLSKPTVTRILGKDGHLFSEKTRQRVAEAAHKLGYLPNAAAKAMGSGRFGVVSLVLGTSDVVSDLPAGLVAGIQDALVREDMHLSVFRLPDEQLTRDGFVPKVLRESMCDGMLINYTHNIPERMMSLIEAHHAPAVWLNAKLPADCVYMDDLGAARAVTTRLLGMGHRRLAYVAFSLELPGEKHYSESDRLAGFTAATAAAGLQARVINHRAGSGDEVGRLRELLGQKDRPTAIVTYNEDAAVTCALAAASLALNIPSDLSLMTFPLTQHRLGYLSFSGAAVPARGEGAAAVRMLLEKLAAPGASQAPVAVPFEVLQGNTASPMVGGH